jgi:transcriptional regulator with XRE-family HTH domain
MPRPPLALQVRLGRVVRRLRSDAGYSQERFAAAVGVHRTSMSAIERGLYDVSLSTLEKIANALDLVPSDLLVEAEREGRRQAKGAQTTSRSASD